MPAVIRGQRNLNRKLRKLDRNLSGSELMRAVLPGAEVLRRDIGGRAPRGSGPAPHLADNIGIDFDPPRGPIFTVDIGPTEEVFWGRYVEQGTSKMSAQPYMRPAVDQGGRRVQQQISMRAKRAVLRAAGI